ncbi:His Kinase A (phospho-acceptor) domain-containing protein [Micromonospora pallida]|uniref:histidine kinase n=1 Tax=Micromonospora pallida TaxID=145854 RepID=A0A1C6TBL1_9ACTN|nr:HAMP domain-containing sensor histidine kinase [Micromonospora pallida]SCL39047.1 His Kinase A (phospho-acceptor) domain-containing protein [Micromonospora pallida]
MPERPDYAALIAGHNAVVERMNSGYTGLPVLTQLLEVAQPALGAAGMAFVEFTPAGGRVIAATGAAEWAVGWPLSPADPTTACLLHGPRVQRIRVDRFTGNLVEELTRRGLRWLVAARAETGGRSVGSLHALHPTADGEVTDESAVIGYLASCVAQMYGDRTGLPVPGDGPVAPALADQERDLFVAVTSHELRTPVTVIKGYANTLTDHWDSLTDADRRRAARVIGQRANELARLVDRLLSSATDLGPGADTPATALDLAEALRSAVTDLPTGLRQRIVLALPADLPRALGDRVDLATVLAELTTNADKYSPPGSPIEISADADERTVAFRVSDRGIGIQPEHVERAFERFWQGESGDRRRYPGAGLGLYLVRRLVERRNGWVSLRPRTGGGTVAEVRLPRG